MRPLVYSLGVLCIAGLAGCYADAPTGIIPDSEGGTYLLPFKAQQTGTPIAMADAACSQGIVLGANSYVGSATHLGKFTGAAFSCVAYTSDSTFVFLSGSNDLTAAYGDGVHIVLDTLQPSQGMIRSGAMGPTLTYKANYLIVGGTGRFRFASGYVSVVGSRELNVPNAPFRADLEGKISYIAQSEDGWLRLARSATGNGMP